MWTGGEAVTMLILNNWVQYRNVAAMVRIQHWDEATLTCSMGMGLH